MERLLGAGAILIGKTNLPEKAADIQTYNDVYGRSLNPWNLEHTPGGSSGGSAGAIAAGLTPLEVGTILLAANEHLLNSSETNSWHQPQLIYDLKAPGLHVLNR